MATCAQFCSTHTKFVRFTHELQSCYILVVADGHGDATDRIGQALAYVGSAIARIDGNVNFGECLLAGEQTGRLVLNTLVEDDFDADVQDVKMQVLPLDGVAGASLVRLSRLDW
jgi:hypothetical protein